MGCNTSDFVGKYDIVGLPQGSDITIPLNYLTGTPPALVDLSTYTAKLQVRQDYNSSVVIECGTSDNSIVLSATSPNISITFSQEKTNNVRIYEDMIYDLEITSSTGVVTRVLEGKFSISRQVTR